MGIIRRMSGWVTAIRARLPRPVRIALDVGRIYGGLRGIVSIWATVVSIITGGTLWAILQSWPVESRIAVIAGVVLAVFVGAGQVGAALRARSGQLSLMGDRKYWDYVRELSEDMAGYLVIHAITRQARAEAAKRDLYRQITLREMDDSPHEWADTLSGVRAPRSQSSLVGEGRAVLSEAVRRGLITQTTCDKYRTQKVEDLSGGLGIVLAMLPQLTGLRGYRPQSGNPLGPDHTKE